jgi:hypothetical protein
MRNGNPIVVLVKDLKQDFKSFVQEEVQLAKTEMTEKVSSYGRHSVDVAVGGAIAYAGLIVLLAGVGMLIAYGFDQLGLDPLLARFVGLGIAGLLVIAVGAGFLLKGLRAFKKESLAPDRTLATWHRFKGEEPYPVSESAPEPRKADHRTSEQIQGHVMELEESMGRNIEALGRRETWWAAGRHATATVRNHPYRWGLIAAGCGVAGSYLLRRRLSK